MYDAIVIGYGPCGTTTAIYLKRFGYNVLLIGKDYGALKSTVIENYYGFPPIEGSKLIEAGIEQAKTLQIDVIQAEVLDIAKSEIFSIKTTVGAFEAKAVMLAMGKSRYKHPLAKEFEGKGISYCATCDGFLYRKKPIAIIGSGNYMYEELEVLSRLTSNITIFTDGEKLEQKIDFPVVFSKIDKFEGDENGLTGIHTAEGSVPVSACFIASGSASGFTLASHLGLKSNQDILVVDENFMTNLEGLFAGGDMIGGLYQVAKATSDGAHAAMAIRKYLVKKK